MTTNQQSLVTLRSGTPLDSHYIEKTWFRTAWSERGRARTDKEIYMLSIRAEMCFAKTTVICDSTDDRIIYAFCVYMGNHLLFMYTRKDFRNLKLASRLLQDAFGDQRFSYTFCSHDWNQIKNKFNSVYKPGF